MHANDLPETKGHHTHKPGEGYVPAEYAHQEYPKAVTRGEGDEAETRVVANADEEKAFLSFADQAEAAAAE